MPVSPNSLRKYDDAELDKFVGVIDRMLSDRFIQDDNYVDIIIPGELSNKTMREKIKKMYLSVGWADVVFLTSSESGERPGLTAITFYM
jgi:hypothetical protein